jgi:hypothetical protein
MNNMTDLALEAPGSMDSKDTSDGKPKVNGIIRNKSPIDPSVLREYNRKDQHETVLIPPIQEKLAFYFHYRNYVTSAGHSILAPTGSSSTTTPRRQQGMFKIRTYLNQIQSA